ARYRAYGWQVLEVDWLRTGEYVEDVPALHDAILDAQDDLGRPTLIVLKTIIGWPAPAKQGTESVHGAALGAEEVAATKRLLGFDPEQAFEVDPGVLEHTRQLRARGAEARRQWQQRFDAWSAA